MCESISRREHVPDEIAAKFASRRYDLCPHCKHYDTDCEDDCTSVEFPVVKGYGVFQVTCFHYHGRFEKR